MVTDVTISGGISVTANFDGSSIAVSVSLAAPMNVTVQLGYGSDPTSIPHNLLTGRDAVDAHPIESITGLTEVLETIPAPLGFTPENTASKKTTLTNSSTDYPSTSAVNRLTELKQTDSPEFADTQITTLDSVANGGVVDTTEATWLGATAKSVLSYLQKLLSKVFAIDSRVAVLEGNIIFDTTLSVSSSSLVITTDSSGVALSLNEVDIMIIHPSMPNGGFWLQVNDITSNYYTLTFYSRSTFVMTCGLYGGIITGKLTCDNTSNRIIGDFYSRAKISPTQYNNYFSLGFIEHTSTVSKINKILFTMASGQIPAGTRIVLKRAIR